MFTSTVLVTTDRMLSHPSFQPYEVVERKGVGHPDTLADAIAELASIRYSEYCRDRFGLILHHNLDKVAVFGGLARFDWHEAEYLRPVRIIFGGRASTSFAGVAVPVADILDAAARDHLAVALPGFPWIHLDVQHQTTDSSMYPRWFQPASADDLPELRAPRASDTAYLVASAPMTTAERVALAAEAVLRHHPWAGSDIKAMVIRQGNAFRVACCVPALVGAFSDSNEYRDALTLAKRQLATTLAELAAGPVDLTLRALDDIGSQPASPQDCYVNVSGSAIDYGEDGLVGRGNGRNGLICPNHGAGNEALFGKNPAYQVGKVGGFLADQVAHAVAGVAGRVRVGLVYRRGDAYDRPMRLHLHLPPDADELACQEAAAQALATTAWVGPLVDEQRYRPRLCALPVNGADGQR
jgi:S-adenosylmethionine synthetase